MAHERCKIILFANTDWYLYNFRRSLALAIRDAGHEVLLLSPNGAYGERLRSLGLRWQPVRMKRRSLNPLREGILLWSLWRLLRRECPDLVHGFTIKCAVYAAFAGRLAGIRSRISAVAGMGYVFTSRDLVARALRPCVRLLLKAALGGEGSRLILQNRDDVAQFEQFRLAAPGIIRLIPGSGVDCTRFRPEGGRDRNGVFRVVLAARLLWDKGVADYIEAARLLKSAGRRIEFLLAGVSDAGNPAAVPEAVVHGWVSEGTIGWLGHVGDMAGLYHSVDVVVLPSLREGLPRGLIEAAGCGLPVVTTDVPGCRDAVAHEVNGLVVPVHDPRALAGAIARLQDDPVLAARLGAAGRKRALEEFNERIVIAQTLKVYRELGVGTIC